MRAFKIADDLNKKSSYLEKEIALSDILIDEGKMTHEKFMKLQLKFFLLVIRYLDAIAFEKLNARGVIK